MRSFDAQSELGIEEQIAFLGPCRWRGRLYDLGSFPGAVPEEGTVHGELFRLASEQVWTVLDRYEGCDPEREAASLFVRRKVDLEAPSDKTAWVYWFNGEENAPPVPSGDWAAYVEQRDGTVA